MNYPIKCVHLITGLDTGGAEHMLYKLLCRMDRTRFENHVISLTTVGPVGEKLLSEGIRVFSLDLKRVGLPDIRSVIRLVRLLKYLRPAILQTWLYHGDLLGLIANRWARVPHLVWNIRCSEMEFHRYRAWTRWTVALCASLSNVPNLIIVNSEAGRQAHMRYGYTKDNKMVVIPNGFDLSQFCPNPQVRLRVRSMLRLPPDAFAIGMVARYDPMKGHDIFFRAATLCAERHPHVYFILAGGGAKPDNSAFQSYVANPHLKERVHLLGSRDDVHELLTSFDLYCSSSIYGEGFPNVIGEAMACGLPCVVTDVGDSARIIGDTGLVVSPRDPEALLKAWEEFIGMGQGERKRMGEAARRRISERFEIGIVVRQMERLYEELLASSSGRYSVNKGYDTELT